MAMVPRPNAAANECKKRPKAQASGKRILQKDCIGRDDRQHQKKSAEINEVKLAPKSADLSFPTKRALIEWMHHWRAEMVAHRHCHNPSPPRTTDKESRSSTAGSETQKEESKTKV